MEDQEHQEALLPAGMDWERFRKVLTRAVRRVCPSWLRDQQEDLVQAALVRVLELLGRRDPPSELKATYLWRVAHSVTVDEIRRRNRRRETALEDQAALAEPMTASPGPDRRYRSQEILRATRECLKRLVGPRRVAVVLSALGHRAPEIAERMQWGPKRVKNLLHRGRADMRSCLTRKGFGLEAMP